MNLESTEPRDQWDPEDHQDTKENLASLDDLVAQD